MTFELSLFFLCGKEYVYIYIYVYTHKEPVSGLNTSPSDT